MTTQIVPSSGQGALYTQQGPGTSPGYSALDDRRQASGSLQEGVFGTATTVTAGGVSGVAAADFMVTQRNAGANMSVDINMPGGGFGYVQGDTINGQGLYCVPVHSSNINEVIATSDASNPRVDQLILEVQDNVLDATGGNLARTRVLLGTPTSGATLSNRLGALPLPGSALLLADVLVPNGATTVPNANIRDRRKWARGFHWHATGLTATGTSITVPGSSIRLESSGAPLVFGLQALVSHSTASALARLVVVLDGVNQTLMDDYPVGANQPNAEGWSFSTSITPGSHTVSLLLGAIAANATVASCALSVSEDLRAPAQNNAVTSG